MKLLIVPPQTGATWVKLGIRTFFKQPLALAGLFMIFMAVMAVLSMVPVLGSALALALLPSATLGLMAATQEASKGKFPMPTVLLSAFRAGKQQLNAMLTLGGMYAAGFMLLLALTALVDGGKFANLYLFGGAITEEMVMGGDFQAASLLALVLYMPLSLLFWHAPALVHWHGISPVKSLFFSIVACWRNFGALTLFGIVWVLVFMGMGIVVVLIGSLLGDANTAATLMFPIVLVNAAMFFTSIYFTFRDSFEVTSGDTP